MKRSTIAIIAAVLLVALSVPAAHAKTAAELLSEGLYAEEVEGNLDSAIGIYQQIIADPSAPRNLVAQALYRQGTCYTKKKQEAEARAVFKKLVTDYSDQTEVVEKVRPMLEELGNADPASLMPPETVAYIEIGSPGVQVETILNMLKGTPFENPLAAMGAGQQGPSNNPAQMLSNLLNPSMLAEFKKIRSLGIGVMDFAKNGPPAAIIVLFPGKSDALRGLLTMALGMAGQPAESIEGMATFTLPEGAGAAYDDTVVILASPTPKAREMLQWSVKQYKGKNSQPSLASANPSFAKVSKQARQQNALTLWVNLDEAYGRLGKVLPPEGFPKELQAANGFINFQNIEDVLATLSLRETGIALEANVGFKNGAQSPIYNMIRTPNLNKAALKAVPADAVALISTTLGAAGSAQAQAIGEHIQKATGQDLAAKIFGNIEQITLFAVPVQNVETPQDGHMPPIAQSIGLAVTSKNPQQTQQLLLTALQMAKLLPAEAQPAPIIPESGRFEIPLAPGPKLFGFIEQANRTMVLSLNPQVPEASITAMRQNASVTSGGPLQEALATLSPTTSKLVLINVGGTAQLAAQNATFPSDETGTQIRQSIDQLIKATQKTTLRLQTNEEANSLAVRLSISDLPPINEVIGPLTQLQALHDKGRGGQESEQPQGPAISIPQAARPPKIDGESDEVWTDVPSHDIDNVMYTPPASEADLSASFKTMSDKQAIYFLVDVADDKLVNDSDEFYQDDTVEIFIDADNSKSRSYDEDDYQFHFEWDATSPAMDEMHQHKTAGVQYKFARTDKGYRLEVALPWSTLGVQPAAGDQIGLDVHVDDDDDGGDRDTKLAWAAAEDVSWENPRALGTGEIPGLVGWWKLDEAEGATAADSSGNGHKATVHGNPAWQPTGGKVAGAMQFDGDGDYLEVADESAFDARSGVTVMAWIRVNAFDKPWQAIVTKGDSAWRIQRNNETSTLEFACSGLRIPDNSPYGGLAGAKEITTGQWHHVAGVYDGRKMYLYVDGALDTSQEASGSINSNDFPVLIGENAEMKGRFFNGLIDDTRVYNYGLPQARIQQLYQGK